MVLMVATVQAECRAIFDVVYDMMHEVDRTGVHCGSRSLRNGSLGGSWQQVLVPAGEGVKEVTVKKAQTGDSQESSWRSIQTRWIPDPPGRAPSQNRRKSASLSVVQP
jgi:hypothetical protein